MGRNKVLGFGLVWLAVLGMVVPVSVLSAAEQSSQFRPLSDVSLTADGKLRGQVFSPQGLAMPGVRVAVSSGARDVGAAVTDAKGCFEISGVSGGVLTVRAGAAVVAVRAWTAKAAPPAAKGSLLVVAGQSQALGQSWGGFKNVITNPWVIAGVVAAAVAIPVAIHNSNDDDPASP